jgi:16S rRNA (guanine527-N7)-methyltransferase
MAIDRDQLLVQLDRSRQLGFLGDGPIAGQLAHAEAIVAAAGEAGGGTIVDLGSGGGLPGLAALLDGRWSRIVLLDRSARRCAFLRSVVAELGVAGYVEVVVAEAESAGRTAGVRHAADAVVSRSFGPPSATIECAAPLVRVGGVIVVADPPGGREWPTEGLAGLGLVVVTPAIAGAVQMTCFRSIMNCDARFPRRQGVPVKRPLW